MTQQLQLFVRSISKMFDSRHLLFMRLLAFLTSTSTSIYLLLPQASTIKLAEIIHAKAFALPSALSSCISTLTILFSQVLYNTRICTILLDSALVLIWIASAALLSTFHLGYWALKQGKGACLDRESACWLVEVLLATSCFQIMVCGLALVLHGRRARATPIIPD